MTPAEIIDAAREADTDNDYDWNFRPLQQFSIRFAAIIAAKQREKDAALCEELMSYDEFSPGSSYAAAIRGQE